MQRTLEATAAFVAALVTLPILVDSAFKGLAVLAGVGVVILLMRRASAASRHLAWTVGVGGLLLLPILSAVLPQWRILPAWMKVLAEEGATRVSEVPSRSSEPDRETATVDDGMPASTAPSIGSSVRAGPPIDRALIEQESLQTQGLSVSNWTAVWLCGAGTVLLRLLICQVGLVRLKLKARPVAKQSVLDQMRCLSRQLRITARVALLVSARRASPMTWGILRPHILLPAEALDWPADRQRAVFLHELAHIRRRDCLTQWLVQVVCALYWYNPLVWIAAWRIEVERERACDDFVLSCGFGAPDYAEHVLSIGSTLKDTFAANTATVAMARPRGLESRLRTILDATLNRAIPRRSLLLLSFLGFVAALLPIAMMRAADGGAATESQSSFQTTVQRTLSGVNDEWMLDLDSGRTHGPVVIGGKEINLTGIASFATPKAYFMVTDQTNQSTEHHVVGINQEKEGIKVLAIEPKNRSVRIRHGGIETQLTLAAHGFASFDRLLEAESNSKSAATRSFVRVVVGESKLTFEGKETSWDQLPALLENVPDRASTVLELAIASDRLTIAQLNDAQARAGILSHNAGFEYLSYIGVHPSGSRGSPDAPRRTANLGTKPGNLSSAKGGAKGSEDEFGQNLVLNTTTPPHTLLAQAPKTTAALAPREVVRRWLEPAKSGRAAESWQWIVPKSKSVLGPEEIHRLQNRAQIEPKRTLGSDEAAMVVTSRFKDNSGRERVAYFYLHRQDGRWLINESELASPDDAQRRVEGFAAHPGVRFDVRREDLFGTWIGGGFLFPIFHTFEADGTYTSSFKDEQGRETVHKGTWEFDHRTVSLLRHWNENLQIMGSVIQLGEDFFQLGFGDGRRTGFHRHKQPDKKGDDLGQAKEPK